MDRKFNAGKAKIAASLLTAAKFDVEYIEDLSVVRSKIDGEFWYVNNLRKDGNCDSSIVNIEIFDDYGERLKEIRLHFKKSMSCALYLYKNRAYIRNMCYELIESDDEIIGHIYGNEYMDYVGRWVDYELSYYMNYTKSFTFEPYTFDHNNRVLKFDFTPAKPQIVDLHADGLNFIYNLNSSDTESFTAFYTPDDFRFAVIGEFAKSGRDDLFRYVNDDGELFTLLFNVNTVKATLISLHQVIELYNGYNIVVECENGLYDGFKLISEHNLQEHEIYRIGDIFFTYFDELTVLEARSLLGGAKTKPASSISF